MCAAMEPLINDEFVGAPGKRTLSAILAKKSGGAHGVGIYCAYAPFELIRAAGAVPIGLCAFSNKTIPAAETVLPANLCPLIKSSYGFISANTCPFFGLSDAVVGEPTCDGKKKMFERIGHIKPMHVMDLPQAPDAPEAQATWTAMIRKLQRFLEATFQTRIADERIEAEIRETNERNRLMNLVFDYAALTPPALGWGEMYDLIALSSVLNMAELRPVIEAALAKLERRAAEGVFVGRRDAPRVMVTGCPINGDSAKVFRLIEEAGGVVVALEGCSGMKPFAMTIEEGTGDPVAALARAYLTIPCSCMTPNQRRLDLQDALIARFQPDAVVDVILQACHGYNVESYRVGQHIEQKHGLPFLKIETDYSDSDVERIRTRVEALLEGGRVAEEALC